MRDNEDLTFYNLRYYLASVTGIPSGQIWVKKPAVEYLTRPDGPNHPDSNLPYSNSREKNSVIFPAINIDHSGDSIIQYNNYGDSKYEVMPSGMVKEYSPLGSIKMYLSITLLTENLKDQRSYGNLILDWLLRNKGLVFINDTIPGEVFSINLFSKRDVSQPNEPYRRIFLVECQSRIFQENTNYAVENVETNLSVDEINTNILYESSTVDLNQLIQNGTFVRTIVT